MIAFSRLVNASSSVNVQGRVEEGGTRGTVDGTRIEGSSAGLTDGSRSEEGGTSEGRSQIGLEP